jgi:TolB protein
VKFTAEMKSMVPVDHLQIVCNGKVVRDLLIDPTHFSANINGSISMETSGWCVLRAFSTHAEYPILDLYPYATTSPVYVTMADAPHNHAADAKYFIAWIDRLISAAKSNSSWNTDAEKDSVLSLLQDARGKYAAMLH